MKSVILYATFSPTNAASDTHIIVDGKPLYIRAYVRHGENYLEALDKAVPRAGETILNTMEIPE